jgi:tellurite resistance protein TerC
LGIVGGVLVISVLLSIIFPEKEEEKELEEK